MAQKTKKQPWVMGLFLVFAVALIVLVTIYLATQTQPATRTNITKSTDNIVVAPLSVATVPTEANRSMVETTTNMNPFQNSFPPMPLEPAPQSSLSTYFNWIYWIF